jgi:hypothetical protein
VVLGEAVSVRLARVLFLQMRRVGQDQRAELFSGRRAEDSSSESASDEPWKVAAVIQMRVREHDRIHCRWLDRQRLPVAQPQFLQSLKQPAVDEDSAIANLKQMLRSGHRASRAEKGQR